MADGIAPAELRSLVREALRDLLPQLASLSRPEAADHLASRLRSAARHGGRIEVDVADGARLTAFATALLSVAREEDLLDAIQSGRLRLAPVKSGVGSDGPTPAGRADPAAGAYRCDSGVVNEARVVEIAKRHRRLVLGPKAVLTPLARDKARELALGIERLRP
jgi:hypothetical protein